MLRSAPGAQQAPMFAIPNTRPTGVLSRRAWSQIRWTVEGGQLAVTPQYAAATASQVSGGAPPWRPWPQMRGPPFRWQRLKRSRAFLLATGCGGAGRVVMPPPVIAGWFVPDGAGQGEQMPPGRLPWPTSPPDSPASADAAGT